MPTKLEHTYTLMSTVRGRVERTRDAHPRGTFSINVKRDGYRYYLELDGEMTFQGDDFDFIYQHGENYIFLIECNFNGVEWKGYFTIADCNVHLDKRYIEVSPKPDDDYRKIEPYMGLDLNILPSLGGHKADTEVSGVRTFRRERMTAEIDEPYDGDNSSYWVGYSVNDWIKGESGFGYSGTAGRNNSLIHKINENYGNFIAPLAKLDHVNQLIWLDYEGFRLNQAFKENPLDEPPFGWYDENMVVPLKMQMAFDWYRHSPPSNYALVEVINHYDADHNWEKCKLIYEREVYEGAGKPAGVLHHYADALYDAIHVEGHTIETAWGETERISRTNLYKVSYDYAARWGWIYSPEEEKWIRYPFNIGHREDPAAPFQEGQGAEEAEEFGSGNWYSELSEPIEVSGGYIRKQVLCKNLNFSETDVYGTYGEGEASNMYGALYGTMTVKNRYHRIESLLNKFLKHIDKEGGDLFPLNSQYLQDDTCPIPQIAETNEWKNTLIGQFSDIKRPEATEKADEEEMSFNEFLDTICGLSNAGWAVVNGEFYFEHAFFFENGFMYGAPIRVVCEILDTSDSSTFKFRFTKEGETEDIVDLELQDNLGVDQLEDAIFQYQNYINSSEQPFGISLYSYYVEFDHIFSLTFTTQEQGVDFEDTEAHINGELSQISVNSPQINPLGIYNIAKDKTFMELSNEYSFDTGDMQKFEKFILAGGEEPKHHKTRIIYDSPIANNKPEENTRDISLEKIATDFNWILSEARDAGLGVIQCIYNGKVDDTYKYEIPFQLDEYLRYSINNEFSLEDIVTRYHWYGRSFKRGKINGELTEFITRPYIMQNISFPYREQLNPYNKIVTELGIGIIREAVFNAMTGLFDVTVGFQEGEVDNIEVPEFQPPPDGGGKDRVDGIYFYRHVQEDVSQEWYIHHGLGTDAIMPPIVYIKNDTGLEEVAYNELEIRSNNMLIMRFTVPIYGEAYFLSFLKYDEDDEDNIHQHVETTESYEWNIQHNLGTEDILRSVVWSENKEIRYDNFKILDSNNVQITYTAPVAGKVYIVPSPVAGVSHSGEEYQKAITSNYALKPFVLHVQNSVLQEMGYESNILEDSLLKLGFSKSVIATIILKQHD